MEFNMQQTVTVLKGHKGLVHGLAFSPDGKTLATAGGTDNLAKLWDVAMGKETKQLKGHTDAVLGVLFTLDGKTVVTIGMDRSIRLFDATSGMQTKQYGPT